MKLKPEAQNSQTKGDAVCLIFIFCLVKGCELHLFLHLLKLKEADLNLLVFLTLGSLDEIPVQDQDYGNLGNGKIVKKCTVCEVRSC